MSAPAPPLARLLEAVADALAAVRAGDALTEALAAKLGLPAAEGEEDVALIDAALGLLAREQVDHTIFWRRLCDFGLGGGRNAVRDLFVDRAAFDAWAERYAARVAGSDPSERAARMKRRNPKFVLRNHLGELAIRRAQTGDYTAVARLQALLENPFDEHPGFDAEAGFPPDWASSIEISCSS